MKNLRARQSANKPAHTPHEPLPLDLETAPDHARKPVGYRAYIGWIADLLYHICMGAPSGRKLIDNRGIVLVDEIDLHLHPRWQVSLIPKLKQVFPKLQFVATTHSPMVLPGLAVLLLINWIQHRERVRRGL